MFIKTYLLIVLAFASLTFAQENIDDKPYSSNAKELSMGKVISMPKPQYPIVAKQAQIAGRVDVRVVIDRNGEVISAIAISGSPLLRQVAEEAALQARFSVSTVNGNPVKVTGTILYNFALETSWESIGYTLATLKRGRTGYGFTRKSFNIGMQGLEIEKEEILKLTENIEIDGKQKRAENLINSITKKLQKISPIDNWYFNLGIISSDLGHFRSASGRESEFAEKFRELRKLIDSAPVGILEERLSNLKAIIKDVNEADLTKEKREALFSSLTKSFNLSVNEF